MLKVNSLVGFGGGSTPFPVVASVTTGDPTGADTYSVAYPSGIQSGDILILTMANQGNNVHTTPTPFTDAAVDFRNGGGSDDYSFGVYYRVCNGTETGNFTINPNGNPSGVHYRIYRVTGGSGTVNANYTEGTSGSANPPSVNAPDATKGTLWFAFAVWSAEVTAVTAYPTNYTGNQAYVTPTSIGMAACTRNFKAVSDDPDAFTTTVNQSYMAVTLAISAV